MQTLELPAENMLPRVLLVRLYDTVAMHHTVKSRVSDVYELSIYLEGNGNVHIQGTVCPIVPGVIRFTKPGTLLSSTPHYRCITVFFDFGTADTLVSNPILDNIPAYIPSDSELQHHFEELLEAHLSTNPTASLQQNALLLSLLAKVYDSCYAQYKYSAAVRTCIGYMQKHFSENITLEVLGALTSYSKLHLLRLFKQDLGQTPHDFLTAIRLEQAKKRLTETDMNLEQISAACGFRSVSHFKTLFKELTHCTPGTYRRNAKLL